MNTRIENIQSLIDQIDDDTLLGHLSLNKYEGIDWENLKWESLDMKKVREDISEHIKTGSFSCLGALEEYVCKCNSLDDIIFNEEYILEMTDRCLDWLNPLTSIFKFYGYDYGIDYVNEEILMEMEDHDDFSERLGIDVEIILVSGSFNSFIYYEHQEDIDKLYDRVRREDKIRKLTYKINSKNNHNNYES